MEFTLYTNPFHNCGSLTLSALLLRAGVSIDHVWSQAGLAYWEDPAGAIKIDPYYRDLIEELETEHGVLLQEEWVQELDDYLARIRELTASGRTVCVQVDNFELPHSLYHQHHHESHQLEVVGTEAGALLVADHHFQYYGPLKLEDARKTFESNREFLGNDGFRLRFVTLLDQRPEYDRLALHRVIAANCAVMEGEPSYLFSAWPSGRKIGLEAIEAILTKVNVTLQQEKETVEPLLESLFDSLKEISNSRYLFHNYLKQFGEFDLAAVLEETAQNWIVSANMLLRALVTNNLAGMAERIGNRLQRSLEQEHRTLERMRAWLAANREAEQTGGMAR